MAEPGKKIISALLDRLYANLVNGPLMSCRPHASRQRVDLFQLGKLKGPEPSAIIASLLGEKHEVKLSLPSDGAERAVGRTAGGDGASGIVSKLRTIIEDARTYEEETGTEALFLGLPLLNLPADTSLLGTRSTKRILAPIAFLPLRITVQATRPATVLLEASGDGSDLLVPNAALLAWVERTTGKDLAELFADEEGTDPWRELNELVTAVTKALGVPNAPAFSADSMFVPTPRSDAEDAKQPAVVNSAVIGLFPAANQGLLRDLEALRTGERATGPIESFLKAGTELGVREETKLPVASESATSLVGTERCISQVDPCQARAVHLARKVNGLVVHGPPGTGKSQTITNIIGDHLAHGERVLFVCDKRTAIDVVAHRLNRAGLGTLCAVIHDARRDQRELYRSIREQLDALPETGTHEQAVAELQQVDRELARLHSELTRFDRALSTKPEGVLPSFHELVGSWFALHHAGDAGEAYELEGVTLRDVVPLESAVKELATRGLAVRYAENPWVTALSSDLGRFLARPQGEWEKRVRRAVEAARQVDVTSQGALVPFAPDGDVRQEGAARRQLAELMQSTLEVAPPTLLAHWLKIAPAQRMSAAAELESSAPHVELVSAPLDRELAHAASGGLADSEIAPSIAKLGTYLQVARKWYAFLLFGKRRAAREVLERFGLLLTAESATRVAKFLTRVRARRLLGGVVRQLTGRSDEAMSDGELTQTVVQHTAVFRVLLFLDETQALASSAKLLVDTLANTATIDSSVASLRSDELRGNALSDFDAAMRESQLFSAETIEQLHAAACRGEPLGSRLQSFLDFLPTVEGLLRINALRSSLATPVAALASELLQRSTSAEHSWDVVERRLIHTEIGRRLAADHALLEIDGDSVAASYQRYRELNARRQELSRAMARHVWVKKQRERLLVSTGSRLKPEGAAVKTRLVTRGVRAMRVRQMIAAGATVEGGDPLFDLRPVWMASPDVVAQVFPRQALFDVVIFDEASQCRLEEALPVLLRAKRVVIAGDPQQLPPTRFFESAVAQSQEEEPENEQELFEAQQSENEDLLSASLTLAVEQAYLDVHYRSSNSDLIQFSNKQFYDSRLQAIPAHPSSRSDVPPLRLVSVAGLYENRRNPREALEIVAIVKRLLSEEKPPSIGVACFNLTQRDLIIESLDRAAAEDADFATRLAAARARQGEASFEGLFVRNLESVQGDERDHIIISTTFGPNQYGKFKRHFGPLGQAGGGRRLNVLVTRARSMVHLVTSIPREVYQGRPELPAGTKPNGALLLFEYLAYAEDLERLYREAALKAHDARDVRAQCKVLQAKHPSSLATALGQHLETEHRISSVVHWGNDGFGVDAALVHPERAGDVTIGILCDGSRFEKAADRVQWDIFRTEMLEGQRWRLHRLWSPQFFRDPEGTIVKLKKSAQEWLAEEKATKPRPPRVTATENSALN